MPQNTFDSIRETELEVKVSMENLEKQLREELKNARVKAEEMKNEAHERSETEIKKNRERLKSVYEEETGRVNSLAGEIRKEIYSKAENKADEAIEIILSGIKTHD